MRVFLAGIMQADRQDMFIEDQNYRVYLTQVLQCHLPEVEVVDPWALNPDSVNYDDTRARHTFHTMTRLAGTADLLIAYLPKPSMGTAMEMWEAYHNGTYIIAITPFVHHWAVRFVADKVLPDLPSLAAALENGRVQEWVQNQHRS